MNQGRPHQHFRHPAAAVSDDSTVTGTSHATQRRRLPLEAARSLRKSDGLLCLQSLGQQASCLPAARMYSVESCASAGYRLRWDPACAATHHSRTPTARLCDESRPNGPESRLPDRGVHGRLLGAGLRTEQRALPPHHLRSQRLPEITATRLVNGRQPTS